MKKLICKINVKRRGQTTGAVYEVDTNKYEYLTLIGVIFLNVSSKPCEEYIKSKIVELLDSDKFYLKII